MHAPLHTHCISASGFKKMLLLSVSLVPVIQIKHLSAPNWVQIT